MRFGDWSSSVRVTPRRLFVTCFAVPSMTSSRALVRTFPNFSNIALYDILDHFAGTPTLTSITASSPAQSASKVYLPNMTKFNLCCSYTNIDSHFWLKLRI